MCLVTLQRKPKITKKDMVVWKRGSFSDDNRRFYSFYRDYTWESNKIVKVKLRYEIKSYSKSEKFDGIVENKYCDVNRYNLIFTEISVGFHASLTRKRLLGVYNDETDFNKKLHLQKFIIPAGSEVFTDRSGLIVSNQMKWSPNIK